jgi:protein TonB
MLRLLPLEIDPLGWATESPRARQRWFALSSAIALALHVVAGSVLPRGAASRPPAPLTTEVFEIDPTPEPPPPSPEERAPDPPPEPARAKVAVAARPTAPAPSPAAAGAVLTASPDDAPLDLSNTFVTGSSISYQGGTTSRAPGLARTTAAPRGSTVVGGSGKSGSAAGPDRSRRASLTGSASWNCPFPQQADLEGINHATSLLSVTVDASGRASSVAILRDPGHGFGLAARACALRRRYHAALDRSGLPVATTLVLNVRFDR